MVAPRAELSAPRWALASMPRARPLAMTSPRSARSLENALSHLIPVGGWASRTDHGNDVAVQKFHVSADIEEWWRVVDFAEPRRILGFVPSEQAAADGLNLGKLAGGVAERAARMQALGDRRGQLLRFQGGKRGVEDGIRAAELTQQLPGSACAEARREGKRKPANVVVGVHREGDRGNVTQAVGEMSIAGTAEEVLRSLTTYMA